MSEELPVHYLYPSNICAPRDPHLIHTVLGSCVAVCLFDPILKIGGMNHYMLPLWNGDGLASPKYGNIAIEKLISMMEKNGCLKKNLIAKLFGGGEVIEANHSYFNVGKRNIDMAYAFLKETRIPIKAESIGGKNGRKILYNTATGGVKMKYIKRTNQN